VGLWCDGLDYVNDHYKTNASRAVFLINDSVSTLRPYASLTDRTVTATQIELLQVKEPNSTGQGTLKLIGLNGELPRENCSIRVPRSDARWCIHVPSAFLCRRGAEEVRR
jgi:hypothetical protein